MGLPNDYILPSNSTDANNLIGDGVCVPVVAFLSAHVLEPLLSRVASDLEAESAIMARTRRHSVAQQED